MHKIYDPEFYKVVFFSSAPIGVPFLEKLHEDKRFEVTGIVTMPDAPAGRGMKMQENVIKTVGKRLEKQSQSNIFLIHGKKRPTTNNHTEKRMIHTKEYLEKQWHIVYMPTIDKTREVGRSAWKKTLDAHKSNINSQSVLVWHSAWWTAITRWLIENPDIIIKKLILIAPGYIPAEDVKSGMRDLYNFSLDSKINEQIQEGIYLLTSNDSQRMLNSAKEYIKKLNPKHIDLHDRWHYNDSYGIQNYTLPELLDIIHQTAFIQTPNSLRLDSKKYADDAKEFQQWLTDKNPDFLVVIAYGKIIPQHILDIPTFWPINVHGSILPKYRGASPIQSVFLDDEKETGITIMKMDAGLDTGDMIDIAKFPIAFDWTAKDVITKMQEVWPQFLVDTLRKYGKWLLGEVAQDDAQATYCGKIEKEDGLIDPYNDSIQSIYNKYRAYILWPKIYWMHGDKRVIVEQLVLDEELFEANKDKPLIAKGQKLTANSCVLSLMIKPEWSKSQSWDDFVKGYTK
jgi:methionyl-tRNA formyltransferase